VRQLHCKSHRQMVRKRSDFASTTTGRPGSENVAFFR
jgi:hypothetical protein